MTHTPPRRRRDTLAVHSQADLVHVVPSLLGFHPEHSLVLVLVDQGAVVVSARADLADVGDWANLEAAFGPVRGRFPGAHLHALVYDDDLFAAWAHLSLVAAWAGPGATLTCAVVSGAFWYASPDSVGAPYAPTTSALAAQAAYLGVRVRQSRAEIEQMLAPVLSVAEREAALVAVTELGLDALAAEARDLFAERLALPGIPDAHGAALLACGTYVPGLVADSIAALNPETAPAQVALWSEVVRRVSVRVGGMACLLLGLAAWVSGEGALHTIALDRAASSEWTPPAWLSLIEHIHDSALPPAEWESLRGPLLALATWWGAEQDAMIPDDEPVAAPGAEPGNRDAARGASGWEPWPEPVEPWGEEGWGRAAS